VVTTTKQVRKTRSRERILTAAAELFHARGLRGVGIDDVLAESGVARSTFYAHFRTKDELVATYLRETDASWRGQLQDAAERAGSEPRDQLVGMFDALLASFDRHGFFGCPFISSSVEAELDSEARHITLEHVARRQSWLTELCADLSDDPALLASEVGLLVDGALASGRLLQDRTVVQAAKAACERLVTHSGKEPR